MAKQSIVVERKRSVPKLRKVTLHVARCPAFPAGSEDHGYVFVAPLTSDGRLDPGLWRRERSRCRAVRFWAGSPAQVGLLKHRAGGAGGATWLLDFDPTRSDDDKAGERLDLHRFAPGEYVTLTDEGRSLVFQVASVEGLPEIGSAQTSPR